MIELINDNLEKVIIYNLPENFTVFHSVLLRIVLCLFNKLFVRHIAFLFAYYSEGSYNFIHLLMPVNLNQYRGTILVFNNRNPSTRKSFDLFSSRLLQQPLSDIYSTKILVFVLLIASRFVIYIITVQNVRLAQGSLFKSLYLIT